MNAVGGISCELWGKILEKLENPKDRLNVLESMTDLQNGLADKKMGWQFALTLPIIMKQLELQPKYNDVTLRRTFMQCRLLCRDCFKGVDKYVEEYYDQNPDYNNRSPGVVEPPALFPAKKFLELTSIPMFFNDFKHHSLETCPIVTKCGSFVCLGCDTLRVERFVSLMEQIGPLLRSVILDAMHFPSPAKLSEFFEKFLQQIPNVKRLLIGVGIGRIDNDDGTYQQQKQLCTFPLPHLNVLSITARETIMPMLQNIRFHSYFPQLKVLQMGFYMWKNEFNELRLFPNLQELVFLHINVLRDDIVGNLIGFFENLDAPQLAIIQLQLIARAEFEKGKKNMYFVEKMGLYYLGKRNPEKNWQSNSSAVLRRQRGFMLLGLFDRAKICKRPLKWIRKTPARTPAPVNNGMCSIV